MKTKADEFLEAQAAVVRIRCNWMEREDVVAIMEGSLGMQCYDNETIKDDFAPSIITSVECGDLTLDDLPSSGSHAEQLSLDQLHTLQKELDDAASAS